MMDFLSIQIMKLYLFQLIIKNLKLLYEKVLDDLLVNQEKLTKPERVKLFVVLSIYIFPKTKSVRDQFTIK